MSNYEILILEPALIFLGQLSVKEREKVFYVFDLAKDFKDTRLFKKIGFELWEFRAKYGGLFIRLFAFWDKGSETTLVVVTHGFKKKSNKIPIKEIQKALSIRARYFKS